MLLLAKTRMRVIATRQQGSNGSDVEQYYQRSGDAPCENHSRQSLRPFLRMKRRKR